MTYRWSNPHDWLRWAVQSKEVDTSDLFSFALENVDADQIQDWYESTMEETGYFDKLDEEV